jgi:hypothetical protein
MYIKSRNIASSTLNTLANYYKKPLLYQETHACIIMRFVVLTAALALGAAALPAINVARDEPTNTVAPVDVTPEHPPVDDNAEPFIIAASEKRSVAVETEERSVAKRATLHIDIWIDSDKRGRHEGLYTVTQKCYNIGNGWNDEISSLSVPKGFGCIFYRNKNCSNDDNRLTVPGGNYIANLKKYDFNDKISSYLCYN